MTASTQTQPITSFNKILTRYISPLKLFQFKTMLTKNCFSVESVYLSMDRYIRNTLWFKVVRIRFSNFKAWSVRMASHFLNTLFGMLLRVERIFFAFFLVTFHRAILNHPKLEPRRKDFELTSASFTSN